MLPAATGVTRAVLQHLVWQNRLISLTPDLYFYICSQVTAQTDARWQQPEPSAMPSIFFGQLTKAGVDNLGGDFPQLVLLPVESSQRRSDFRILKP